MTDFSASFALLRRSASSLSVSVYEAVGMMTAVVSAPELLLPSDWLNALLREDGLADASDAQAAVQSIMSVYNALATDLQEGRLDPSCFETFEQVCEWCVGYLEIAMLDATWSSDGEALAQIDSIRMLAVIEEMGPESAERVKAAMLGFDSVEAASLLALESAVAAHAFWEEARRALAPMAAVGSGQAPYLPYRRSQPKVGRNQPCPCGSGKKFKRCCGAN